MELFEVESLSIKSKGFHYIFVIQYQDIQDYNLILILYNDTEWNSGAKSYSVHYVFFPITID